MTTASILNVSPRAVLGKKVKLLRRQGVLPANIYGPAVDSLAVQTDARDFGRFIRTDAIRGVFAVQVEGETAPRSVILRAVTRAGGTGEPMHVDFLQVDPERQVEVTVPLRYIGESPAVRDLAGTIVPVITSVRVRCLPARIPTAIDVDLGVLKAYSQAVTIGDLAPGEGVQVLTRPHMVIVSVAPPRVARR